MRLSQRRIGLLLVLFLLLLGAAAARAAYFGTVRGPALQRAAVTQQVSVVDVPPRRGTITDRHGVELAISEPADDVAATPYLLRDPAGAARRLAPLLGQPEATVRAKLADRRRGFVYLARQLPDERSAAIKRLELPGMQFIPAGRRTYPQRWLASQLLGSVGTDGQGLAGLEHAQDHHLRGRAGRRRVVNDALGQPISVRDERPARTGDAVRLTIDATLQSKVEAVLQSVGERWRPKGASALVMDPRTGELLAVANSPRVDANSPSAAPPFAGQNRVASATYEPGSTFKAFTIAGALEERAVTPQTPFVLEPQIRVADRIIREAHPRGTEHMTTSEILAKSSNVGAITIGQRLGAERFDRWTRRLGFGRRTGVDLPGEERGVVPALKSYSGSTMGNLPIGQGLSVTPMQVAAGYAAIANGGMLRAPHVVAAVGDERAEPPAPHRVLSPATAAAVRRMLGGVVRTGGTGVEAAIPGYTLAGKTGTANKVENGRYSDSKYIASFVGFAPARDPRLLVAVMVDEPKGAIFGGSVAGPAFQEITSFALPYLRIPPR